jgi:leukotriene-A4 hydrolase
VYVATHEIAHSWTGNEVTCRDWSNMWLNEGFTVFEERKVSGQLKTHDFALIEAQLGNVSLWVDIMNPVLNGDSPDDSFSQLPYEKGFQFLTYLETLVGETLFQTFVRTYIKKYSLQSITYLELKSTWEDFVNQNFNAT